MSLVRDIEVKIAKFLMKLFEFQPTSPSLCIGGSNEVFRHHIFIDGSEAERKEIMLQSSKYKYEDEMRYPWDRYFGISLLPFLGDKTVLDLGCFTGGRTVAWAEIYKVKRIFGVDIENHYINAAARFAEIKGVDGIFECYIGEHLPFENEMFDAILSFDVFEHVKDPEETLNECNRVLKNGGRLFAVFPSYFHPNEHHLSFATMTPFMHYFFRGNILIEAYNEIIDERGDSAYWYKRINPSLEDWERGNTINGITSRKFRHLIKNGKWKVVYRSRLPIFAVGRNVSQKTIYHLLGLMLLPFARTPILEEFFCHRVTYILEKALGHGSRSG